MSDYSPGQTLQCTITKAPMVERHRQTIERLMRQDPGVQKALKNAHRIRQRDMRWKMRGGKIWYNRPRVGKIVRVAEGESWTMPYIPQIERDLAAVDRFVKVETV